MDVKLTGGLRCKHKQSAQKMLWQTKIVTNKTDNDLGLQNGDVNVDEIQRCFSGTFFGFHVLGE